MKTTKALADSIQSTKATVFATVSGVAYYEPNGTVYTEESKCESYDFLSSRILFFIRDVTSCTTYICKLIIDFVRTLSRLGGSGEIAGRQQH